MEEYVISKWWRVLYWALCAAQVVLLVAGVVLEQLVLALAAFGSYLASLWLVRCKNRCPACGGLVEGSIVRPGQKELVCRACGAKIALK